MVGEQPSPVVQTATLFGSALARRTVEDLWLWVVRFRFIAIATETLYIER